jgi:hypothetical protein
MLSFLLVSAKIVGYTDNGGVHDIKTGFFPDFPDGRLFKGLATFQMPSWNRKIGGMRTFPFSNKDPPFGVDQKDTDPDIGKVSNGLTHLFPPGG